MIVKDVCMHTVVCTVQGSLFVQLSFFFFKKKNGIRYSFFFFFFFFFQTAGYGHNADVEDK